MGGTIDVDIRQLETERGQAALNRAETRIGQLEKLNATLAAEIDRMRHVVEAAQAWYSGASNWSVILAGTVAAYEAAKEQG